MYEFDTLDYRVVWEDENGGRRYSKHFRTEGEARVHATTHHKDWPWAITMESHTLTLVYDSTDDKGKQGS